MPLIGSNKAGRAPKNPLVVSWRFWRSNAGTAAVEFAFILPVLLLLYAYLVEFSRAMDEKRKVDRLAQTIADLVSQQNPANPVTSTTLSSILGASAALTAPYPATNLSSAVSVVTLKTGYNGSCCSANVSWSVSQGGSPRPCGSLTQVADTVPPAPNNILASVVNSHSTSSSSSGQVIIADVQDGYQPIFGGLVTFFSGGFTRTSYFFLRQSGQLTLQSSFTSQQGQQAEVCS